jgi:hypothetical protein
MLHRRASLQKSKRHQPQAVAFDAELPKAV